MGLPGIKRHFSKHRACRLNFWVLGLLVENTTPLSEGGGINKKCSRLPRYAPGNTWLCPWASRWLSAGVLAANLSISKCPRHPVSNPKVACQEKQKAVYGSASKTRDSHPHRHTYVSPVDLTGFFDCLSPGYKPKSRPFQVPYLIPRKRGRGQ